MLDAWRRAHVAYFGQGGRIAGVEMCSDEKPKPRNASKLNNSLECAKMLRMPYINLMRSASLSASLQGLQLCQNAKLILADIKKKWVDLKASSVQVYPLSF